MILQGVRYLVRCSITPFLPGGPRWNTAQAVRPLEAPPAAPSLAPDCARSVWRGGVGLGRDAVTRLST